MSSRLARAIVPAVLAVGLPLLARCDDTPAQASPGGYDVYLSLTTTGPQQQLLLDSADAGGLVLTFDSGGTTLSDDPGGVVLGNGRAAKAGEVHVRRRMPQVEVLQQGEVLLRTCSSRPLQGTVQPGPDAGLGDWYVQETVEPFLDYGFADLEGTAGIWEDLKGPWKLGVYRDALFQRDHGDMGPFGASWYEVSDAAAALTVAGADCWAEYRARVVVQAEDEVRTGLAFYVLDADNYGLLSVQPAGEGNGVARLSVFRHGEETPLCEVPVTWRAGTWYELAIEATGEHVVAAVAGQSVLPSDLPCFTGGRVGLFADGTGKARFDDVSVRPVLRDRDDFRRELAGIGALGQGWQEHGGNWELRDGCLRGSDKATARCLWVAPLAPAPSVSASVLPRFGAGGICLNWAQGTGYVLYAEEGSCTLASFSAGAKKVLWRTSRGAGEPVRLRLSWDEGRLVAVSGDTEHVMYDFAAAPSETARCGLLVAGQADFRDFEAGAIEPAGATIATVTGLPQYVPGEGEGTQRPAIGYVWKPRAGSWRPCDVPHDGSAKGLAAKAHEAGRPAELWYYQPCPGDTRLSATDCIIPQGAVFGLALTPSAEDRKSGYSLEHVGGTGTVALLRLGEVVAQAQVASTEGADVQLWRDGAHVVGRLGDVGLTFEDPTPLKTAYCAAYGSTDARLSKLALSNRRAAAYCFASVEADWQPEQGQWMAHSGMACIAWDYWLTGKGEPIATAFNRLAQPSDLHVDFWISEYTEGFSDGEHRHYPYHDVSLITCASARQEDSGYRFVIGADGGKSTRILRLGKAVAETSDRRFGIVMGGHCNAPRAMHVVISQEAGRLRLVINDQEALVFEDPEPLPGGLVGIGVEGCAANFRDLWMAATGERGR